MAGPITVAMLNRKGGCGKTSTCHHLAGAFAKDGLRVLLVDMDPQASLTQGLFGPQATEALPDRSTVVGLFDDSFDPDPDALIKPTPFERISLVPGSNALDDYNVPRPQDTGEIQLTLRRFLKEARDSFDVALIDCPPNLSLCSWAAALLAADSVVVPVQAEDYRGSRGSSTSSGPSDHRPWRTTTRGFVWRVIWSRCSTSRWASMRRTITSCGRSTATRSSRRRSPWPRTSRKPSPPASRSRRTSRDRRQARRSRRSPTS